MVFGFRPESRSPSTGFPTVMGNDLADHQLDALQPLFRVLQESKGF
jgi:hypothetical protein